LINSSKKPKNTSSSEPANCSLLTTASILVSAEDFGQLSEASVHQQLVIRVSVQGLHSSKAMIFLLMIQIIDCENEEHTRHMSSPDDEEVECLIDIAIEFISESYDHIL